MTNKQTWKGLTDLERFEEKVDRNGDGGCWNWTASCIASGYGNMGVKRDGKWRVLAAHRLAWEFYRGPIPHHDSYHGLCVCHTCDNRRCVNPEHLFLATNKGNTDDRDRKGRNVAYKGERHGSSKLTENQVREIRALPEDIGWEEIAKKYGIGRTHVRRIRRRESWAHI